MEGSRELREELRRELPAWQAWGIVSAGAARALAARYGLEESVAGPARAPTRDRAVPLAAAAGLAVAGALAAALSGTGTADGVLLPVVALAAAFGSAPLAIRHPSLAPAACALRVLGRALFYPAAWALSFVAVADALRFRSAASPGLLAALPLLAFALAALARGLSRADVDAHARGEAMLLAATVVAFAAGLFLETGAGTAVVANLALAFLAAGRIVRGLSWNARAPFWEGLAVAAAVAASRAGDVSPAGWPRAAAALLVLAAAAVAGLLFERRRSRAPLEPAARSL